MTSKPDTHTLKALTQRRITLAADKEYIEDEIQKIDAQIHAAGLSAGTHDLDGVKLQIRSTSRVDYKKVAADYPAEQYPNLYQLAIDSALVKKQFAPAALEPYKGAATFSIVIPKQ